MKVEMAPPATGPETATFRDQLRAIRADIQHLSSLLLELDEVKKASSGASLGPALKAKLLEIKDRVATDMFEVTNRLASLPVPDGFGGDIEDIKDRWEDAAAPLGLLLATTASPDPFPSDQAMRLSDQAKTALTPLVTMTERITIPDLLNSWLRRLHVGQSFDFHKTFRKELPEEAERRAVLEMLADTPLSIDGIVDVNKGVVYKASRKTSRRVVSWLLVLGTPVVGGLLVALLARLIKNNSSLVNGLFDPQNANVERLLILYLLVLAGAVFHILISFAKRAREKSGPSFLLGEWTLWVHVHESTILSTFALLLVLFILLAYFVEDVSNSSAFFAGYFYDSAIDLLIPRFETVASEAKTKLETTLKPPTT